MDEQLCFALYHASRRVTAAYRPLLDALGLTYPQYITLLALWERAPLPMKALAEATGLDYGTLTPLVKRLEASGLITRTRRTDDERAVDIDLTQAGRQLHDHAAGVPVAIGQAMGLSDRQFVELKRSLELLAAHVDLHLQRSS